MNLDVRGEAQELAEEGGSALHCSRSACRATCPGKPKFCVLRHLPCGT